MSSGEVQDDSCREASLRRQVLGQRQAGELISFFTYVTQVLSSLMMLGMIFISLVMVRASNHRILEVLNEIPDIDNPSDKEKVMTVKDGSIKFNNVNFSYNKKEDNCVLSNINPYNKICFCNR